MVDSAEPRASAAGEAMLVARLLDRQRADTLGWISGHPEAAAAWYDSTAISSGVYWLTQEEAKLLSKRIEAMVIGFERRSRAGAPAGAQRVRVSYSVVPVPDSGRDVERAGRPCNESGHEIEPG